MILRLLVVLLLLYDPYVQIIGNWFENLHDTWTQQILNIYRWNFWLDMC